MMDSIADSGRVAMIALGVDLAFGLTAGTQWAARRLAYGEALGAPAYQNGSPAVHAVWLISAIVLGVVALVLVARPRYRRASGVLMIVVCSCLWLAHGAPIYAPLMLLVWQIKFWRSTLLTAAVREGWVCAGYAMVVGALATLPFLRSRAEKPRVSTSHGSAAWDSGERLLVERGLILGWQDDITRACQ